MTARPTVRRHPDPVVADAGDEVRRHLGQLAGLFAPECHLTFVMRHPARAECWMVITNDPDLEAVAATVTKQASVVEEARTAGADL